MTREEKNQLLRQYAAGEVSWTSLRSRGFESYRDVLAGLGRLHLRPPIAPMDGPNIETRRRAREVIRSALQEAPEPTANPTWPQQRTRSR